jgi:hypothetical protein
MKKISTIFGNYWNDCPSSCSGPEGAPGYDGLDGQDGLVAKFSNLKMLTSAITQQMVILFIEH